MDDNIAIQKIGYVASKTADIYRVVLYTEKGWRGFKFPYSVSKIKLNEKDPVRCFLREGVLVVEPIPREKVDESLVGRIFDELAINAFKSYIGKN